MASSRRRPARKQRAAGQKQDRQETRAGAGEKKPRQQTRGASDQHLTQRQRRDVRGDKQIQREKRADSAPERDSRMAEQQALLQHERLASLGTTLAGVAHELNNPLAAISGFAQLLLKGAQNAEDRIALEAIHREAARASTIVRELLSLARPNGGEAREPVDLNAVVSHILAIRRYALETRGVDVRIELAESSPTIFGVRQQIEQLVLNLIVNAEHALSASTDADGAARRGAMRSARLTVCAAVRGDMVVLEVRDNGIGIAPEALERIWDPFYTTKSHGEGTGLGLAVARGIVRRHGGKIEAESAPGEGTCLIVLLPAYDQSARDSRGVRVGKKRRRPRLEGGGAVPLDVLVVAADPSERSFLQRYLARRGHAVLTAEDPGAAVELLARTPLDVVICDLQQDGAAGTDIVRHMLEQPAGGARPRFVVTSGAASAEGLRKLGESGMDVLVARPYRLEELRQAVEGTA